jgi:peptidoglycan-associated lipoprotein
MLRIYRMYWVVLVLSSGFLFMVSCKSMVKNDPLLVKSYEKQEMEQADDFTSERQAGRQAGIDESDVDEEAVIGTEKYRFYNQDVIFPFDDYSLTVSAREILKDKAQWLIKNPNESIIIEGHCDERGTNEYNLALGDRRAESVKSFLVDLGIDEKRMKTTSYGEERPLDAQSNEAAWAKNRRAHFVHHSN